MSWAPFVALFIARISKGRTIRQTVAATLILPTLADFLWYGVVGGAGIHYDVTQELSEHGLESAVFATAQHLPLTGVLAIALLFLIATFFLTSANSAALALSMFVSGKENPGRNLRAFWGIVLGAVAAVLAGPGVYRSSRPRPSRRLSPLCFFFSPCYAGRSGGSNAIDRSNDPNSEFRLVVSGTQPPLGQDETRRLPFLAGYPWSGPSPPGLHL